MTNNIAKQKILVELSYTPQEGHYGVYSSRDVESLLKRVFPYVEIEDVAVTNTPSQTYIDQRQKNADLLSEALKPIGCTAVEIEITKFNQHIYVKTKFPITDDGNIAVRKQIKETILNTFPNAYLASTGPDSLTMGSCQEF